MRYIPVFRMRVVRLASCEFLIQVCLSFPACMQREFLFRPTIKIVNLTGRIPSLSHGSAWPSSARTSPPEQSLTTWSRRSGWTWRSGPPGRAGESKSSTPGPWWYDSVGCSRFKWFFFLFLLHGVQEIFRFTSLRPAHENLFPFRGRIIFCLFVRAMNKWYRYLTSRWTIAWKFKVLFLNHNTCNGDGAETKIVKKWRHEMNTKLIFSGAFSKQNLDSSQVYICLIGGNSCWVSWFTH